MYSPTPSMCASAICAHRCICERGGGIRRAVDANKRPTQLYIFFALRRLLLCFCRITDCRRHHFIVLRAARVCGCQLLFGECVAMATASTFQPLLQNERLMQTAVSVASHVAFPLLCVWVSVLSVATDELQHKNGISCIPRGTGAGDGIRSRCFPSENLTQPTFMASFERQEMCNLFGKWQI